MKRTRKRSRGSFSTSTYDKDVLRAFSKKSSLSKLFDKRKARRRFKTACKSSGFRFEF